MKVLGYVHTFNDAEVIDATIRSLCQQTYPIPEILLVDNASTDGTIDRTFPDKVTIIKNDQNLGTSGAVVKGMEYALAHRYDWIYILDADSEPQADAIENLIRCYENLSPEFQASTWWLSSLLKEAESDIVHQGCVFGPRGPEMLDPPPQPSHYLCHTNMWSGSLYRLAAVRDVGLPDPNYVLDWGDVIYGYEGLIRGYTGFIERSSVALHRLHPVDTVHFRRFGTRYVKIFYSPPIRFYYMWRNTFYFLIYRYKEGNSAKLVMAHSCQFFKWMIKAALFIKPPGPMLRACLRGMWDGLHARLENRY